MPKPTKKRAKRKAKRRTKQKAKKLMSKAQVVSHLAERVGTQRKTVSRLFSELHKLAIKEAKTGEGCPGFS